MNNLYDVKAIVDEYLTETGRYMEKERHNADTIDELHDIFREAERKFNDGLAKLHALKLSRDDRRHFSLITGAFATAMKSCQYGAKGRYKHAVDKMAECNRLVAQYVMRQLGRVSKS
ncbi:hypothetical protein HHO41_04855 [Bacillus sp. DNRA2]|uniref:hypothetical protein n=1 Tax=Bacillus sp. DNRA2 TaxID=2723053 RepID=UPI00145DB02F|nr:hypothetical protein [Bacillus sp. DNRA2]NMD69610.1 hypothetical protein [Bacillus sp. DNRA2]